MKKAPPPRNRLVIFQNWTSFLRASATAAGALIPALLILLSGHTLVWRDTSKLFQPIRTLVVEALRNFELPLWNPHEALGIPLFAQMMHSVLHPVSVLGAFLFPHAGMDVFILIYIMLAALGSAMLARVLGASPGAATVAGLAYGLSGYVLGMGSIIQYLCAAATAPWALIGLRIAGEGRRFAIVTAAIALAVLYFAGDPQWTIICMLIGTALAAEAGGVQGFRNAAIAIVIGTALAGIQLIPTAAYLHESARGMELDGPDRLQWALAPWRVIEFIVPGFFGSPGAGTEKWPVFLWLGGQAQRGMEMPFAPSIFIGAGVIFLAAAGLRYARLTRLLGIASLILLWLALGTNAGSEQLLHPVPVWGKLRYAEKMVGPLTLCLSILAAFGADRFSNKPSMFGAALAGAFGLAALASTLFLANWQGFEHLFTNKVAQEAAPFASHNLTVGLLHAGLVLTAFAGILAVARRWPRFRASFPAVAAALIFLQSSFAAPFALLAGDRSVRDEHPLQQIAHGEALPRIVTPIEQNYLYPTGLNDFDAQIGAQSHIGAPAYNVPAHIDQFNTYTGLRPRRLDELLRTFADMFGFDSAIALRRYATTHMIVKNPYFPDEVEVAKAAEDEGVKVLENRVWGFTGWKVPHRPWAVFAERVVTAPGKKEALDALVQTLARGESTVVLERAEQPKALSAGQVLEIRRGSNRLRIEADSPGDGILVVNDSFWPGWTATIDGSEMPIWRADFLVRAVPWPAGRHVLEMRYDPPEVRTGWLVSLAGAIALITLTAFERHRTRPSLTVKQQKEKQFT